MPLVKLSGSSLSTKQNINIKRFTGGEMIGVYDYMAKILWPRYFIEAKWYNITHNRPMQDNKSAIILEKIEISTAPSGPNT